MADPLQLLEMLIPADEPTTSETYKWATVVDSKPTRVVMDSDPNDVVLTPNVIPGLNVGVGSRVLILRKAGKSFIIGGGQIGDDNLLWSGNQYMNANQVASLAQLVSDQATGIVLSFARYVSGQNINDSWSNFFVPRGHVLRHNGAGVGFTIPHGASNNTSAKYLYVYDDRITGNAINSTSPNTFTTLRYIYGV